MDALVSGLPAVPVGMDGGGATTIKNMVVDAGAAYGSFCREFYPQLLCAPSHFAPLPWEEALFGGPTPQRHMYESDGFYVRTKQFSHKGPIWLRYKTLNVFAKQSCNFHTRIPWLSFRNHIVCIQGWMLPYRNYFAFPQTKTCRF